MAPQLRPLGETLGMEALGVDLSGPPDAATKRWIDAAFAEHPVLVFRNQRLDAAELLRFARQFGAPQPHILKKYRHPDFAEVSYITNVAEDGSIDPVGNDRATSWHTDETYNDTLPRLAMLHALEVPSARGGTIFVDMRAVYAALPEAMRRRLAPLTGTHRWLAGPARAWEDYRMTEAQVKANPERYHPVVLTHPVSERPILFVNPSHSTGFAGVDPEEGERLVAELCEFAVQERFTYYHQWRIGDLLMWDELATMHRGAGDAPPQDRRVMLRTIVHPN
jgi:taurine dioxygenase